MNQLPPIRSLLFAPGSDERKLKRALGSIADAVVADLEDAVTPDNKSAARMLVVEVFGAARDGGPARFVRVNAMQSTHGDDDLAALAALDLDGIIVPKATPDAIAWLGEGETPVIAVIETAAGLRAAFETASCPRVQALQLGGADLGAELGLTPRADGQEILFARSQLVVDSAAAGIRAPIDVVHLDVHNSEALEHECVLARNVGMRGKACIHPAQLEVVNRAFLPTDSEVAWAAEIIDAFDAATADGRGALLVRGELVDLPLVTRAQTIIAEAQGGNA
jgi:citrate lyase subunit beta/citryl-CoA lyase